MIDRRRALFGLGVFGAALPLDVSGVAQASSANPDTQSRSVLWERVREMAHAIVSERLAPGLQISARQGHQILFEQGFGQANLETATPLTSSSVMRIGSATKQFTAATILLLEEEEKLSVRDRLAQYLPSFPRAEDITLEQMLNHTSGLGNYTDAPSLEAFLSAARPDRTTDEMVALVSRADDLIKFEPGSAWAYSNTAFVLLGAVIEVVDGKSLSESLRDRLFRPIGLTATAVDSAGEVVPGRASGYTNGAHPSGFENASFVSMSYPGAAGAMRSTTTDLCRWHQALFGGRVLSETSMAKMLRPATLADGTIPKDGAADVRYAFGLELSPSGERVFVGHGGAIQGFVAHVGTYVATDLTIATIVNADGGYTGGPNADAKVRAIRNTIRDGILAS